MTIRIEKSGFVWTIIHSRPEARGAMDPEQANVLYEAFLAFNADDDAYVAVSDTMTIFTSIDMWCFRKRL